jgi:hypothetical protein
LYAPRRDEVKSQWRKLHNEELNDLYCLSNVILVIKSRRMRWGRRYRGFWWGNRRERDHLENPGLYGRIILR